MINLNHIDLKKYPNFSNDVEFLESTLAPQSIQFMIDILPTLRKLIIGISRSNILSVLDVGTATGAGANLLQSISSGIMFGPKLQVSALDREDNKYDPYPQLRFPDINYIKADIFSLNKDKTWDFIICSHTIEHMANPVPFIKKLQELSRNKVLIYCPYNEKPLLSGHEITITKNFIDSLNPLSVQIIDSPGWQDLEGKRRCVLFVLDGSSQT